MLLQAMAGEALYCYDGAVRMATMSRQGRRRMIKNNNVGRSQERRIHRDRRFAVAASTAGSDLKEVDSIISVETPTLKPSSPPPQQESLTTLLQSPGEALKGKSIATVKGTVVLMRKTVLGIDLSDVGAKLIDDIYELIGRHVSFQLVSATVGDPNNGNRGMVGKVADLKGWSSSDFSLVASDCNLDVTFKWDEDWGVPGAVIVNNYHPNEFYLKTLTLENVPGKGRIQFVCNSWVYPEAKYKYNRVFFSNDTYLPCDTPLPLQAYREDELINLRGDDVTRQLQTHDRIYRYDYYNDLGKPDKDPKFSRRVLGGSQDFPYPRRARTGRPPTKTEPESESRLSLLLSLGIYVPRDEKFGPVKLADFIGYTIKSVVQGVGPGLVGLLFRKQYKSFKEVLSLYEGGLPIPDISGDDIPFELIKELLRTDGENLPKLPVPQVIQADDSIWRTDEEFGREMVAGVDPVIIRRLEEFPPTSNLDPKIYGDHCSKITEEDLVKNLNGLTVDQALENNKLFILDHYDTLMPYLNRINSIPGTKIYASRTILYLKNDGTLKPVAIELALPDQNGEQYGAISKVYTPADYGVENAIWQLAKAYVAVNDSGVHQLLSHWLNTHAVIEPFIIATNRQLSVVHPIHKLMKPHYHDTTYINALARGVLINADGVLEKTVFPGKYALEMSAVVYKNWKLTEQGLPDDLLKRGVAVEDPTCPYNLRLLIEDYPFAVDGLAIWSAIDTWVTEYCSIYYPNDAAIVADTELQAWWKEVREVGHGDKKDETWWPEMCTVAELTKTCTTIIWIASALHAAVNFGQYPYAGYLPNRPTLSRVFMPEPGSPEFEDLKTNPDKVYLNTITGQFQAVLGVTLIEILSRHSSDELYLGQRDSPEWTSDQMALQAFYKFRETLVGIEKQIVEMNQDPRYKNRTGPVQVPYTLLYPNASHVDGESGLTGRGVPNSVSI